MTGGRLGNLAAARVRSVALLIAGAGGQVAVTAGGLRGALGFAFVLASYVALAGFAARNLAIAGMGVVLLGVALNLAPIVADGGMPVEGGAIVRARVAPLEDVAGLTFGAKRHLAHPGDHLRVLDDTIPDWLTHEVLSAGDLVVGVGVGAVVASLVRGRRSIRTSRSPAAASSGDGSDRPTTG
ncbi:MAG: hypothetical protein NVSMB12_11130 [Acidimicrobiales bacterium]